MSRQTKKYDHLASSIPAITPLNPDRIVVNLLDDEIGKTTRSVLAKGLNLAPSAVPYRDFIVAVEPAIRFLPRENAEEVRSQISLALKRDVPPKPNIPWKEKEVLRRLKDNPNIVVLPADKGNATVLLKMNSYYEKVGEILSDPAYQLIPRDPTESLTRKTSILLKKSGLPPETCKGLLPQAAVPPRLYGLPKIHKGSPLYLIVSAIKSPTYPLVKYLTKLLAPLMGHNQHHLQNSTEFGRKLSQFKVEPYNIMVTFDLVSLFTKVPIKNTLNHLESRFDKGITDLFHHTLNSTYFLYQGRNIFLPFPI
ncbi:hypothetical protein J437_LFUL003868 [Ladona fulva]|uniref:Reverse transcriptase domain-containing protein n=1 Tax=Ladona fulva TaxID=123851 RepID=A0A8K0P004_LADFU|nr:hypothetical protein J437_LFUL003868 [Ladona fulva]